MFRSWAVALISAMLLVMLPPGLVRAAEDLPDVGLSWTTRTNEGAWLHSAAEGAGQLVVVGDSGEIKTSADGTTWVRQSSGTTKNLLAVAFGNGTFVAVGQEGTLLNGTGSRWTSREAGTKSNLSDVAFGRGTFVVVGEDGVILTSADGAVWTTRDAGTKEKLYGVTYGGGQFVAVGYAGTILTSADGQRWVSRSSGTSKYLSSAAYGNGMYLVVGESDTVLTSADGATWKVRTVGGQGSYGLWSVAFGDGQFVAAGGLGNILSTRDGAQWFRNDTGKIFTFLDGVEFVGGQFLAVGNFGTIRTSSSGGMKPVGADGDARVPEAPQAPEPPADTPATPGDKPAVQPAGPVDVKCEAGKVTGDRREVTVQGLTIQADGGSKLAGDKETLCGNITINRYLKLNGTATVDHKLLELSGTGTLYIDAENYGAGQIVLHKGSFTINGDMTAVLKDAGLSAFKLAGLDVEITKFRLMRGGVQLAGKLRLPKSWGTKEPIAIDQIDIVDGRLAGFSVKLPDIEFSGKVSLTGASATYLPKENLFSGEGKLEVEEVFSFGGALGFREGRLEKVAFDISGFNAPIDGSGFFIYRIAGGVDGLTHLSTMKIKAAIGISGGPKVGELAVIDAKDLSLEVDMSGRITASGTVELLKLVTVDSTMDWLLPEKQVLIVGHLNFQDAIVGEAQLRVGPYEFYGRTEAEIRVPEQAEWLGGMSLAKAVVELDMRGFAFTSTVALVSETTCKVNWQFAWACETRARPFGSLFGYVPVVASTGEVPLPGPTQFTMPPGLKGALVVMKWDAGDADFSLTAPDGTVFTPETAAARGGAYHKNDVRREALYGLPNPQAGTWTFTVTGKGARTYNVELLEALAAPTFAIVTPAADTAGASTTIEWQTNAPAGSKVSLFYAKTPDELGTRFAKELDAAAGRYVWDARGLPSGTYYIYGMLDDGEGGSVRAVAPGRVRVENPSTPAAPRSLTARAENGSLVLKWAPNTETDLGGYRVTLVGVPGQEITLGLGTEYTWKGLQPGKTYQVAVSAYDTEGYDSAWSAPVSVFLPAPTPPSAKVTWPQRSLTNQAQITVGMQIEGGAVGTLYQNDTAVASGLTGTVSQPVTLRYGENRLRLVATKPNGDAFEESRTITLDDLPPHLAVDGLQPSMQVQSPVLFINGTAEPTARLTLNGQQVRVRPDGGFAVALRLKSGSNPVELVAKDEAGNEMAFRGAATPAVSIQSACGSRFPDVAGSNKACAAVEQLAAMKVVSGYPDGSFQPGRSVTRAEFSKMLVAALGLPAQSGKKLSFRDTASHWSATSGYLQAAVELGALSGFPDGTFQPDAPVTRAQVVKIAAAAAGLQASGHAGYYQDVRSADWFDGWAMAALEQKLIGPDAVYPVWTGASFGGNEPATRAEAAMVLANLLAPQK